MAIAMGAQVSHTGTMADAVLHPVLPHRIITNRLTLTRVTEADYDDLVALHFAREGKDLSTLDVDKDALDTAARRATRRVESPSRSQVFLARMRTSSKTGRLDLSPIVGQVSVYGSFSPGDASIGYWVLPQLQGHGIGTEMAGAVTHATLQDPKIKKVIAETERSNDASNALLSHLQFRSSRGPHGNDLHWELDDPAIIPEHLRPVFLDYRQPGRDPVIPLAL